MKSKSVTQNTFLSNNIELHEKSAPIMYGYGPLNSFLKDGQQMHYEACELFPFLS